VADLLVVLAVKLWELQVDGFMLDWADFRD
jgi:hypothetical protein